ncbi:hypothetical protein C8Q80DRAFT_774751 [Daedaleopsis nitida]|nr:hypothetical protein C8Q80DRAFT_774751 [Daedaleopsis nitida]
MMRRAKCQLEKIRAWDLSSESTSGSPYPAAQQICTGSLLPPQASGLGVYAATRASTTIRSENKSMYPLPGFQPWWEALEPGYKHRVRARGSGASVHKLTSFASCTYLHAYSETLHGDRRSSLSSLKLSSLISKCVPAVRRWCSSCTHADSTPQNSTEHLGALRLKDTVTRIPIFPLCGRVNSESPSLTRRRTALAGSAYRTSRARPSRPWGSYHQAQAQAQGWRSPKPPPNPIPAASCRAQVTTYYIPVASKRVCGVATAPVNVLTRAHARPTKFAGFRHPLAGRSGGRVRSGVRTWLGYACDAYEYGQRYIRTPQRAAPPPSCKCYGVRSGSSSRTCRCPRSG